MRAFAAARARAHPTDLVCSLIGGRRLVQLAVLEQELQERRDLQAVDLLKVHAARDRAERQFDPNVVGVRL